MAPNIKLTVILEFIDRFLVRNVGLRGVAIPEDPVLFLLRCFPTPHILFRLIYIRKQSISSYKLYAQFRSKENHRWMFKIIVILLNH